MGAASLQPSQAALLEGSLLAAIRVIRPSLGFRGKLARVLREQTWDPIDDGKGQFGCA
jgi:hypothetical protein